MIVKNILSCDLIQRIFKIELINKIGMGGGVNLYYLHMEKLIYV